MHNLCVIIPVPDNIVEMFMAAMALKAERLSVFIWYENHKRHYRHIVIFWYLQPSDIETPHRLVEVTYSLVEVSFSLVEKP